MDFKLVCVKECYLVDLDGNLFKCNPGYVCRAYISDDEAGVRIFFNGRFYLFRICDVHKYFLLSFS